MISKMISWNLATRKGICLIDWVERVYICIYAQIYIHIYIHNIYIHTSMYTCMYTSYIYLYIYMIYIFIYTYYICTKFQLGPWSGALYTPMYTCHSIHTPLYAYILIQSEESYNAHVQLPAICTYVHTQCKRTHLSTETYSYIQRNSSARTCRWACRRVRYLHVCTYVHVVHM